MPELLNIDKVLEELALLSEKLNWLCRVVEELSNEGEDSTEEEEEELDDGWLPIRKGEWAKKE